MKKRKMAALFMAMCMAVTALSGCSGKSGTDSTTAAGSQTTQPGAGSQTQAEGEESKGSNLEVQTGGTLTIAIPNYTPLLDPKDYTQAYEASVIAQVAEPLLTYNAEYTDLIPILAKDWSVSDDGLVYHFVLRDDVYFQKGKFQDGRKLVSDDVKFSLERIAAECSTDRICREFFDHVEVISDTEFDIHLKEACGPFLEQLADVGNVIIPKEEVEGWGEDFADHLIGSGPFILESMTLDESVVLKRNEDYWGEKANLDQVILRVVTDGNQAVNALITGEVQIAEYLQAEAIQKASDAGMLVQKPTTGTSFARFNMQTGPTADPRVREAIIKAVDIDAVIANVYQYGEAVRSYQPLTNLSWGYNESYNSLVPAYDPEGAKALLKEAGYENGMTLNIYIPNTSTRERIAQLIQYYLGEVGITLNIHSGAFAEILATVTEGYKNENINMYAFSWSGTLDPYSYLEKLFSRKTLSATSNAGGYDNEEVDRYLYDAFKETDREKRIELYNKAMEIIMNDYTGIYIAYEARNWGVSPKVHNTVQRADGRILLCTPFNNVWIEQ